MPRTQIGYSKCVIYKIEHIDDDSLLYVGLTTNFNKRKGQHKSNCKKEISKEHNHKVYRMTRENGGWDMFKMIKQKNIHVIIDATQIKGKLELLKQKLKKEKGLGITAWRVRCEVQNLAIVCFDKTVRGASPTIECLITC